MVPTRQIPLTGSRTRMGILVNISQYKTSLDGTLSRLKLNFY